MKTFLSCLIAILLFTNSFGQIDFKGDSMYDKGSLKLSQIIDSTYKLKKDYNFEFRFWTNPSLVAYSNVFILTQKDKIWSARFFECNGHQKIKISETKLDQTKLDSLWIRLIANQILTLPTQDSLRGRMKIYVADTSIALDDENIYQQVQITDGISYRFELFTQSKSRSYEYHCPSGYLKYFPNIEELYRAFVIIILIEKYLGLKLTVC